jgi:phosphatidylinositol alpha-1,6-mannosyltransferase
MALTWNALQTARYRGNADLIHAIVEPYALSVPSPGAAGHVMTLHGTYAVAPFREGPLTRWAFGRALRTAKGVVCVSQYTRSRLLEKIELDDVRVIPNGARLPRDTEAPTRAPEKPLLLGVGEVKRRKGYHVTIEAVALLKDEFPSLEYVIVGDTGDRRYTESLRQQISDLGLGRQVKLAGRLPDNELKDLYRSATVFALTPVNTGVAFEGFGLAYLEAGSHALPVIGSLGCGAEDAIIDGKTGYLVPQEAPDQIAARIRELLMEPARARALGESGREHAHSFAWEQVAESYLDVYKSALSR